MMNEQENAQAVQPEAEELEVEVVDQVETADAKTETVSTDDELENYTKGVSKRINKLNERNRAAEEKAARLEQMLAQKEMETASMLQQQQETKAQLLVKEEEALEAKQLQADDLYKKAIQSNDAELISKADTLKSDLSIQKEKLKVAKQQAEQQNFQNPQPVQQPEMGGQAQAQPEPSREAKEWHSENSWYGDDTDPTNQQATQFAYFTHFNLINEGYEADSQDYYDQLNSRVYKVYPDLQPSGNVEQSEGRPAVQRVASTSVGGRQKTQGKKNGVTFSKSEVERLRGLKPHNMTEDAWLKSVAKEKQKIANREAK
mgnify:CR=1 FL=1|tara:strand:+ start:129 stop:1076 length:948 start_codon:yes stop_codon:yes gene_type:complete